jgi:hypothetical protein
MNYLMKFDRLMAPLGLVSCNNLYLFHLFRQPIMHEMFFSLLNLHRVQSHNLDK